MAIGLSNARLAIPKVNQNPRPPKLSNAKPLATKLVANRGVKPVGSIAKPSPALTQAAANIGSANFSGVAAAGSAPGSTSAAAAASSPAPAATAPAAAPAPSTERFAIPSWTPAVAGEPDPRDASYWANLAKLKFTDEQEFNKAGEEETKSNANYSFAVQQALAGRKVQERELGENAIKGNLGASGWLNRNEAEQTETFTNKQAHESLSHEEELHAFNTARKALEEGFGIEAAQEMAEAGGRYAAGHKAEAEEGEPEYAEEPGSPAAPSAPGYAPGSPGNKNNTKKQGVANNQKAGAGNNKSGNSAVSNNQVAGGGKPKKKG